MRTDFIAETYYSKKEIVSRTSEGTIRYTYAEFAQRTSRLSSALANLGVERGDRVGTFAWNDHRHLEAYFAIPCMGSVLHTVNIRLAPDQIAYIINHAEDKVLLVDAGLAKLLEPIHDKLTTVKAFVLMGAGSKPRPIGSVSLENRDVRGRTDAPFHGCPNRRKTSPAGVV